MFTDHDGIKWIDVKYNKEKRLMRLHIYANDCAYGEYMIVDIPNVSQTFAENTYHRIFNGMTTSDLVIE